MGAVFTRKQKLLFSKIEVTFSLSLSTSLFLYCRTDFQRTTSNVKLLTNHGIRRKRDLASWQLEKGGESERDSCNIG